MAIQNEKERDSNSNSPSKSSRRLSKMGLDWRKGLGKDNTGSDRTNSRVSVREVRWDSRS